jgi:hypothetical protein
MAARYKPEPASEKQSNPIFDIDPQNIVQEWIDQPRLYFEHAEKLAQYRANHERCKANLDLVQAKLDKSIRSDPEDYDISSAKITEKMVENAIIRNKKYIDALEEVHKSRYEMEVLQAAVTALDHRKKLLESLTQLTLSGLNAEPKLPRNQYVSREMETEIKKTIRGKAIEHKKD